MTPDDVRRLEIGRAMDREDGLRAARMENMYNEVIGLLGWSPALDSLNMHGVAILKRQWWPSHCAELAADGQDLRLWAPDFVRSQPRPNGYVVHVTHARMLRSNPRHSMDLARKVVEFVRPEADAYLGKGWGVEKYIWEVAGPSDESLYPYHRDNFDGCKALKVYVYLNDIGEHNGVLEYAPGSHKAGAGSFHPRPLAGPAGTIVLFDPRGVHGSGALKAQRHIFRAHLVERKYVLRHLPEQLQWYLKPVNKVMRWTNSMKGSPSSDAA